MMFLVALRKELLEQLRTHRLLAVAVVFFAFGLLSPLLALLAPQILAMVPGAEQFSGLIPEPSVTDAVDQYLKNMSQFGIILALLLTMGAVTQEKERGTAALMLVKPLPRGAFLSAKLCASAVTFLAGLLFGAVASYAYTALLFGSLPVGAWAALNALLWVYLMVYVALTLLASTVSRSLVTAGAVAVGLMATVGVAGALPPLVRYLPGRLLVWGAGQALGAAAAPAWPALAMSLGLIAVAWLAAVLSFRRQEL